MKSNIALSMGFLFLLVLLSGQTSAIELRNGTIFNTSESNSSVSFTIPVDADFVRITSINVCPFHVNVLDGWLNITNTNIRSSRFLFKESGANDPFATLWNTGTSLLQCS